MTVSARNVGASKSLHKVLYSSIDMHNAIKHVLGSPQPGERRVAIVAYVGATAEAFIPYPKDLEIVCALEAGATCAQAIDQLRKRGADVRQSDRLHMKVYWSSIKGCVIGSANASTNALGKSGLKEAGVLLPAGAVDIEQLLTEAGPRVISNADLRSLRKRADARDAALGPQKAAAKRAEISFVDWYESAGRTAWKICWWAENDITTSAAAKSASRQTYGKNEPADVVNVARGEAAKGEWLLCFKLPGGTDLDWMYVDFVVAVSPTDRKAYDREYPFQAVQVHDSKRYPTPPFKHEDPLFQQAFEETVKNFGVNKLMNSASAAPPRGWLKQLREAMG